MKSEKQNELKKYLNPIGLWALSFGCSVGWGAFVMPGTTFLPLAGPAGTAAGLAIGALIMLIIGENYSYLIEQYPDSGGTFSYTKHTLGNDHAFLNGWFLILTYIVIIWANITAISLIKKYLFGSLFDFGFHYNLAGSEIYLSDILIEIGLLVLCGAICLFRKRFAVAVQILMAFVLFGGIVFCFVLVYKNRVADFFSLQTEFSSLNTSNPAFQIIGIIMLAPWAYVGFESVSQSSGEMKIKSKKIFPIIIVSLITSAVSYILLGYISIAAVPNGYENWAEYINSLNTLNGYKAIPTFFSVYSFGGKFGVIVLFVAVIGGIITGVIGNLIAAGRVIYTLSRERIVNSWFGKTNKDGNVSRAILTVVGVSSFIPFLGRTAISWIIDVTTVCATIIYCYTSIAAYKTAKQQGKKSVIITGLVGIAVSVAFAAYFLIPYFSSINILATESYLILTIWSIMGLLFFRVNLGRDKNRHYGKSIIVWVILLLLILFTSVMWMQQANTNTINEIKSSISSKYDEEFEMLAGERSKTEEKLIEDYVDDHMIELSKKLTQNSVIRILMILIAVSILFSIYSQINKRQNQYDLVEHMAYRDLMTGVENKHAYQQSEKNINREINTNTASEFAIVICDINNLKHINDNFGHTIGDEYIKEACNVICDIFAHSPIYRIGGDEFIVILREADYNNRKELFSQLNQKNIENEKNNNVIIAYGYSEYIANKDKSVADIFKRADVLMYENKRKLKKL